MRINDLKEHLRGHQHRHPAGRLRVIFVPVEVSTDRTAGGPARFVWWNQPLVLIEVSPASESSSCCSVTQSCLTLCDPMDCSTPGLPVLHCLPELLKFTSIESGCHPAISSSVSPFSSCPQSFPASGSFLVSQLFASGGQSVGSFSFSISPSNEYSGLISLDRKSVV